jgi:hypothetical protein
MVVAAKVKKQLKDDTCIIPLSIDEMLSYDDSNIEFARFFKNPVRKVYRTC